MKKLRGLFMNIINLKKKLPVSLFMMAAIMIFCFGFIFVSNIVKADDGSINSGRLVTIHDRGEEKSILTEAKTVGDVLKEAGITLDGKDTVEPNVDTELVSSSYQINIYRARPVIIVDGNIRLKVVTPYQTAEQIAMDAGITLYDEDITTLTQTDVATEGAGLKLTITRAIEFSFELYGKTITARTQAKTIGEMLSAKGIELSDTDKVSPSADSSITSGMIIRVWREGRQTVTVDEPVAFDTEQIESADYQAGYTSVRSAGANGERTVTYEIVVENGIEVSRTEINSLTTKQPVTQVEVIGVKGKYNTPSENENIAWDYLISQGFSEIQAAGIMGNLMQEHHFNTTDTSGGLGIVQWTGNRRTQLIAMYPMSYDTIYAQLDYLMYELNGSYVNVKNSLLSTNSLGDAVRIFQNNFEKCGVCVEGKRIEYAQNILASH